jgi:hypothetical protein
VSLVAADSSLAADEGVSVAAVPAVSLAVLALSDTDTVVCSELCSVAAGLLASATDAVSTVCVEVPGAAVLLPCLLWPRPATPCGRLTDLLLLQPLHSVTPFPVTSVNLFGWCGRGKARPVQ